MKRTVAIYVSALLVASLACISGAGPNPTTFDIAWYSIDAGGGDSSGGAFDLSGTIGQHDTGEASGGAFVLDGGFWTVGGIDELSCPPDISEDGGVDVTDLLMLLSAWGPCSGCIEDIDNNGAVDVADLLELLSAWGPCA